MTVITLAINTHVYNEILDKILILSIENWFVDDEVIFPGQ